MNVWSATAVSFRHVETSHECVLGDICLIAAASVHCNQVHVLIIITEHKGGKSHPASVHAKKHFIDHPY